MRAMAGAVGCKVAVPREYKSLCMVWCVMLCACGEKNDATQHPATNRDAVQYEAADASLMVGGMDEMRWMNGGMGENVRILGWAALDWIDGRTEGQTQGQTDWGW